VAELNYDAVGSTQPAATTWPERVAGYRRFERTACVGHGHARWDAVAYAVLRWQVKIRSGFTVEPVDGSLAVRNRSLTRPAGGAWGWAFPVLLLAQRHYRARYLRAFAAAGRPGTAAGGPPPFRAGC
jgi:uncharacterized protein (UPF0548 family)